jgi:parallel beta-helix repeat protein
MTVPAKSPVFYNPTWKKALLYAGLLAMGSSRVGQAADFVVTTLTDSGAGSLRAAIVAANNTAGADTISFAPGLTGTIQLSSQLDSVIENLTISGPGASVLTIRSAVSARHLAAIGISTPVSLTVSGLTFTNGSGTLGGAIYAVSDTAGAATLTIQNCVLSGNTDASFAGNAGGGAIRCANTNLTVLDTVLTGNAATYGGAAIYSDGGRVIIRRSTISNNTGNLNGFASGGAIRIANGNNSEISNSTIANNTIADSIGGGGVHIVNSSTTIDQCTISNNTAAGNGGGILIQNSAVTMRSCTIASNAAAPTAMSGPDGGGISLSGTATLALTNTIVSGNTATVAATRSDISSYSGTSGNNNLVSSPNGLTMPNQLTAANGNLLGTMATPLDPLLGALQNNGGTTLTRALQAGSPAINAGTTTSPFATDQRGFNRVSGSAVDIGAVEADTANPTASLTPIANVTDTSTATELQFTVVYSDDSAIKFSSLGDTDVRVTGPNGFSAFATLVSATPSADGQPISAVYKLVPPGGAWDVADNGVYTISLEASQVLDFASNPVAAGVLGYAMVGINGSGSNSAVTVTPNGTTVDVTFNFPNPPTIPLTTTVDFGDGTTGSPGQHTYAQPGTYTVTVTVTGNGGTPLTFTQSVTVSGGGANFRVRVSRIKLSTDGTDSVFLYGVISVPSNIDYSGKTVDLDVGGATQSYTLDKKGKGASEAGTIKFNRPRANKRLPSAAQELTFRAVYTGSFATAVKANTPLDDAGLPTSIPVTVLFNSQTYQRTLSVKFKTGRSGSTTRFGFF